MESVSLQGWLEISVGVLVGMGLLLFLLGHPRSPSTRTQAAASSTHKRNQDSPPHGEYTLNDLLPLCFSFVSLWLLSSST